MKKTISMLIVVWLNFNILPAQDIPLYKVFEKTITNTLSYGNKFKDVSLNVTYTHPSSGATVNFWGFYDGNGNGGQTGNVWKIRFMPTKTGIWNYTYTWSDGTTGGSGNFNCVSAGAGKGIMKAYQGNTNWFAYNGTEPVFLKSYYVITGGFQLDDITWAVNNVYQKIADKGYNHVQLNMLPLAYCYQHFSDGPNGGSTRMYAGTTPSTNMSLSVARSVDQHMAWLNDHNISVNFFEGIDGKDETGATDNARYANMSSGERDFLVRYICARLAPYANIMGFTYTYETGDGNNERDLMDRLAAYDPWGHLKTMMTAYYNASDVSNNAFSYAGYTYVSTEAVNGSDRNGCNMPSSFVYGIMRALSDKYNKPIYHAECWGMWKSCYGACQTSVIRTAWANTMAAASATWNDMPSCENDNKSTDIFSYAVAAKAMDVLADVMMNQVQFYTLNPYDNISNALALAEPGVQYLIYKEDGGNFNIKIDNGIYSGVWMDTKTGNQTNYGTVNGNGSTIGFTTPNTSTDWVFVIRKTGLMNITHHETEGIKIYSNLPGDDFLKIEMPGGGRATVLVYTITGEQVYQNTFSSNLHEVPTSLFKPGLYIVRVNTREKVYNQKVEVR